MKFSLNTTIINPDAHAEIKNAVILLHGYGGDGYSLAAYYRDRSALLSC